MGVCYPAAIWIRHWQHSGRVGRIRRVSSLLWRVRAPPPPPLIHGNFNSREDPDEDLDEDPDEDLDEDPDEDLDGSDGVPYLSLEREGAAHSRALSKLAAIKLLLSTLYVG